MSISLTDLLTNIPILGIATGSLGIVGEGMEQFGTLYNESGRPLAQLEQNVTDYFSGLDEEDVEEEDFEIEEEEPEIYEGDLEEFEYEEEEEEPIVIPPVVIPYEEKERPKIELKGGIEQPTTPTEKRIEVFYKEPTLADDLGKPVQLLVGNRETGIVTGYEEPDTLIITHAHGRFRTRLRDGEITFL